jgi:rhamnosyltransferase
MHRCILFAHYDRDGIIDDHVIFLLKSLRPHAGQLIFVSVSAKPEQLARLNGLCDVAFKRDNTGYDFMSWKEGIRHIANLDQLDEVLFINDSIYGPLDDLKALFERADKLTADFWGLTRSHEIRPHIQSYFFAFRRSLIETGTFSAFWQSVEPLGDKRKIIRRYEVGMTEFVETRGAITAEIFDQRGLPAGKRLRAAFINGRRKGKSWLTTLRRYLKGKVTGPTHAYWRSAIEAGVPFLKVELLRDNPRGLPLRKVFQYLATRTNYDPTLIERHLRRVTRPDTTSAQQEIRST